MKRVNAIKRQWFMPIFMVELPVILMLLFCYLDQQTLTAEMDEEVILLFIAASTGRDVAFVGDYY